MTKTAIWLIFAACLTTHGFVAQSFRGTIVYDMTYLGEKADVLRMVMPTTYTVMIGRKNTHYEVAGGSAASSLGRVLYLGETGETWLIRDEQKTAYRITGILASPPPVHGVAEEEDEIIAGYSCDKFLIQSEDQSGFRVQDIWISPDIILPEGGGYKILTENFRVQGVDGHFLKSMTTEEGTTIVLTAKEVDSLSSKKSKLKIPKGYTLDTIDVKALNIGL